MKAVRPPHMPSDIRALLAGARPFDEPSVADRERVGRALAHTLGVAPEPWIAAPELVIAKTTLFGAKLLGLLAVLSLAAVGTWVGTRSSPAPPPMAAGAAAAVRAPEPAVEVERVEAPPVQPASAPMPVKQVRGTRARTPSDSANVSRHAALGAPSARADSQQRPAHTEAALEETPGVAHSERTDDAETAERPSKSRATLQEELRLITAASSALDAQDLEGAAEALRTHATRFAAGFLREEREALRASLACERGDASANALRSAFERRYPRSPERLRIAQHCDRTH